MEQHLSLEVTVEQKSRNSPAMTGSQEPNNGTYLQPDKSS
jgi:hypothetical protein